MALSTTLYDALIVGAGPAGLSVALGLSRTHRRAAVFTKPDGAGFRNEGAAEMHNVISRDGIPPAEFRSVAKEQIMRYGTVDFIEAEIVDMHKVSTEGEGSMETFQVTASDGRQWTGRKLALAMGSVEVFPDIEGYKENWPENIFQCFFCDGHERSHLPGGVLTFPNPMYAHMAQMMQLLVTPTSGPVTVFTDGPVPDNEAMSAAMQKVEALECKVETGKIIRLVPATEPDVGVTVVVDGGKEYKMGYLGHKPPTVVAGAEMVRKLGIEIEDHPIMGQNIKVVDPLCSTNVKGVFVAGDAGTPMKAVANAIGSVKRFGSGMVTNPFNDIVSKILDYYLTRRYPISHQVTGRPLPGRPYRWPNGQGDAGKFLDGIENRRAWAKEHGHLYRIWAGMKPEVYACFPISSGIADETDEASLNVYRVLQKPEHVKLVFRDSDRHSKASNNDSGYLMGELLGQCLGLISGADWRALRRVSEPSFRHSTAVEYIDKIQQRVNAYCAAHQGLRSGTIDPVADFKFLPFLIIADILYGPLTPDMEAELCQIASEREELFRFVIKGGLTRYTWSRYLPSEANRALKSFQAQWRSFNEAAFRRARDLKSTETPVYQLFEAVRVGQVSASNVYQTLDEMLFANLDVTMGALSWNVVFLAAHVDAQEQLFQEITTKAREGEQMMQYVQSSSTYLASCIMESSRLKPLAAFSVPQAAPTDRVIDGYVIPAGTSFIVDSYALNVENEFWGPDRREYRPARFEQLSASETRYHMWRFGFGPRQCLGKYVADLTLRLFLLHLVQNWTLRLPASEGSSSEDWRRDLDSWITHPRVQLTCKQRQ
ncbi:hypothetical protein CFD26_102052 [Aspergillus turcosus]|uniref:FAD/NAD(P)-binding domain-containing protein n=1 Tax=Aspergillus turcosus TaxID=1245748 RepID=A0A421CXF3_9EURO|nr:hypothetical protein CFD26_102052 [Aspergillus turcosus]